MTTRGIPCIYYGTEQYLHDDTEGGNDPYNRPMMEKWDTESPIYRDVRLAVWIAAAESSYFDGESVAKISNS